MPGACSSVAVARSRRSTSARIRSAPGEADAEPVCASSRAMVLAASATIAIAERALVRLIAFESTGDRSDRYAEVVANTGVFRPLVTPDPASVRLAAGSSPHARDPSQI